MISIKLLTSGNLTAGGNLFKGSHKLTDLQFLIPLSMDKPNLQIFVKLVDSSNVVDIIKLHRHELVEQGNLKAIGYQINLDNSLRIASGETRISLLIFNQEDYLFSSTIIAKLTVEQYSLEQQTYLAKKVTSEVGLFYKAIVDMYNRIIQEGEKL